MAPVISTPLIYHWKVGELPPPVTVAVKVSLTPAAMWVPGTAVMETEGVVTAVALTDTLPVMLRLQPVLALVPIAV